MYVTSREEHELSGSKGTAHLVMKFAKGSKKEASVNVMEIKGVTRPYTGGCGAGAWGVGAGGVVRW